MAKGHFRKTKTFLDFSKHEKFQFIRTPDNTPYDEILEIPSFSPLNIGDDYSYATTMIEFDKDHGMQTGFHYVEEYIINETKKMYNKENISQYEINEILLANTVASFIPSDDRGLFDKFHDKPLDKLTFVTNRQKLLKNRLSFSPQAYTEEIFNIVSFDEACEIVDLFLKFNNEYRYTYNASLSKFLFYLYSLRTKVRNFDFSDGELQSLTDRLIYLLMAIDNLGFQYFLKVHNDTSINTAYHFNYLITLMTGIFDYLALYTNSKLGINFNSNEVSLNPNDKNFLKAIRGKQPDLRKHIQNYIQLIKLIHEIRNPIIHGELLPQTVLSKCDSLSSQWKFNTLRIDKNIKSLIRQNHDNPQKISMFSEWGCYDLNEHHFVEPYTFSKTAAKKLLLFVNNYLKILGHSDIFHKQITTDSDKKFLDSLKWFEVTNLGF
ncbi:hypothetical protein [Candidatus Leptofilum sp.]|uniref:hypothetical protein n=1 Tax=Candidatus Leptofilum sp. TaxID=3241576 RepID=UPI003B5B6E13